MRRSRPSSTPGRGAGWMTSSWTTGTVNLRSCGRSANRISLIRYTRPGESRRRTGENRPRTAQVDSAARAPVDCIRRVVGRRGRRLVVRGRSMRRRGLGGGLRGLVGCGGVRRQCSGRGFGRGCVCGSASSRWGPPQRSARAGSAGGSWPVGAHSVGTAAHCPVGLLGRECSDYAPMRPTRPGNGRRL